MDMCKVTLIGFVQPRDPEPRFTPDGRQVTNFSMVCKNIRRGRDGERTEESEWFRITTFGRLAETAANLVTKGSRIYVEGRLSSRVWQDNEGKNRTSLEVIANELFLLDSRQQRESQPAGYAPQSGTYPSSGSSGAPDNDLEDLPF